MAPPALMKLMDILAENGRVYPIDETKALAMAAVNLRLAEEKGLPVVTMCSACGEMLNKAKKLLDDEDVAKEVNKVLQKPSPLRYRLKVLVSSYWL